MNKTLLERYINLYLEIKEQIEKLLEKEYMNEDFQNQTFLPEEFKNKK